MSSRLPSISETKDYILAACLLVIAAGLLISRNEGGIENLRSASITIYSYLEEPLAKFRIYKQSLRKNRLLRKQNIRLRDKLNRLRSAEAQNDGLKTFLAAPQADSLELYPVQFVGKELHHANNVLTINAGSKAGIKKNMPVIAAKGLVGKIIITSRGYAEVMPYLNTLFKVSAKLKHSNAYGIVSWNGENINQLELNYVPQTVRVDSGETVLTSGYGQEFPPGIPIGKVARVALNKGRGTLRIYIKPAVNLYSIATGFVLTGKPDTSRKNLLNQYQKLFK